MYYLTLLNNKTMNKQNLRAEDYVQDFNEDAWYDFHEANINDQDENKTKFIIISKEYNDSIENNKITKTVFYNK